MNEDTETPESDGKTSQSDIENRSGRDSKTYVPYQPAFDAGISEEMDRLNFRRLQLAERRAHDQLTEEEEAEFKRLQETFFNYLATIFPRPRILDDDRLEKLEQKYNIPKNP